ncbi:MAG: hypothetical protein NLN64_05855 [Candidatus Thalassarchaeaceae archaeon]|nr:hypothetical protein [Candidatus Thalassarchaeaceae archaeon]
MDFNYEKPKLVVLIWIDKISLNILLNYVINGAAAITVIVSDTYPKIKKVNICPECIYVSEVNLLMKECLDF